MGQRTEIQMLRDQLEEFKGRERRSLDKEASLLEREAKWLEKMREVDVRQQALVRQSFGASRLHEEGVDRCATSAVEQPARPPQCGAQICQQTNIPTLEIVPNEAVHPLANARPDYSQSSMAWQPNSYAGPLQRLHGVIHEVSSAPPSHRLHHMPGAASIQCDSTYPRTRKGLEASGHVEPRALCSTEFVHRIAGKPGTPDGATQMPLPLKAAVVPVQSVQASLPVPANPSGGRPVSRAQTCAIVSVPNWT